MSKRNFAVIFLAIGLVVLSGCSLQKKPIEKINTAGEISQPKTGADAVKIGHFVFEPKEIVVNTGAAVVWTHDDNVAHSIISPGLFESEVLQRGGKFSFKFDKPGEYSYYCGIHPSMTGKIIVK
ncbi:MAG: cupredoxin domain-containing protein [Candidatus Magasanikbacteria bacterium]|nr:cupredoxin domain-containing protein [Candidatus Magasanikbacteria bacterium]